MNASTTLDKLKAALDQKPGLLLPSVDDSFRSALESRSDLSYSIEMLEARGAARQYLVDLETRVDSHDLVSYGPSKIKFSCARLIGTQAYLATKWALADRISVMAGRVFCSPEVSENRASPVQLISHFVQDKRKKSTAAVLYKSMKSSFGWSVGISYAIRNHFVHDGGQANGSDFFAASTPRSAFQISAEGWVRIEETARNTYFVDPTMLRTAAVWPDNSRDDLREVLRVCEQETDDALGVLLGSACHTLRAHVSFMLGED
jgi:hypothetical protein